MITQATPGYVTQSLNDGDAVVSPLNANPKQVWPSLILLPDGHVVQVVNDGQTQTKVSAHVADPAGTPYPSISQIYVSLEGGTAVVTNAPNANSLKVYVRTKKVATVASGTTFKISDLNGSVTVDTIDGSVNYQYLLNGAAKTAAVPYGTEVVGQDTGGTPVVSTTSSSGSLLNFLHEVATIQKEIATLKARLTKDEQKIHANGGKQRQKRH